MPSSSTPPSSPRPLASDDPRLRECRARYWRSNVRLMAVLLFVWAFAGLGCGVLWADWLDQWHLGGFPLGFWFAQQGSIIAFVLVVLVYALSMGRLDRAHHRELESIAADADSEAKA